ncbi:hypothetical protein GCM10027514_31070 [Azotobacter armeniacus]
MSAILEKNPLATLSLWSRRLPTELGILLVLVGIGLAFELFGWVMRDHPSRVSDANELNR